MTPWYDTLLLSSPRLPSEPLPQLKQQEWKKSLKTTKKGGSKGKGGDTTRARSADQVLPSTIELYHTLTTTNINIGPTMLPSLAKVAR